MNRFGMCDVVKRLQEVLVKIDVATKNRPKDVLSKKPILVAVSKTKPKELIIAAYVSGQQDFGENYVQELVDKSNDPKILETCTDIRWHFIGNLQRNKITKLLSVPNLYVIETVDSERLADALDGACARMNRPLEDKLKVMIQINTSGEPAKHGAEPVDAVKIAEHIKRLRYLELIGLMTIGRVGHDLSTGPNPDFQCLIKARNAVSNNLSIPLKDLDLSMGMSDDFENAIEVGSTNVRIGSYIFGGREYKKAETTNAN